MKKIIFFLSFFILFSSLQIPITEAGGANFALSNDSPEVRTTGYSWSRAGDNAKFTVDSNSYTAIALKPTGDDYDLSVYSDFNPTDNMPYNQKGTSTIFGKAMDYFIINGYRTSGNPVYYAKIYPFTDSWGANYYIESDYQKELKVGNLTNGNFRGTTPPELIDCYSVYLYSGGKYTFSMPSSTNINYRFKIYTEDGNTYEYIGEGNATNQYTFYPATSNWYGVLLTNNEKSDEMLVTGSYKILVASDYELAIESSTKLVSPGMNATYKVKVISKGIISEIKMTLDFVEKYGSDTIVEKPDGADINLLPESVIPSGVSENASILNINTNEKIKPGIYYIRIWANDTSDYGVSRKAWLTLIVSDKPDFYISITPDAYSLMQGSFAEFNIKIETINNFNENITLKAKPEPKEDTLEFEFKPNPVNFDCCYTSSLKIKTSYSTKLGSYIIELNGSSGEIIRYQNISLTIAPPMNISIISPLEGEFIGEIYTFKARVTGGKIFEVRFLFSGVLAPLGTVNAIYSFANDLWELNVNTNPYDDGRGALTIHAIDSSDTTATCGPRNFTVQNMAPQPEIVKPKYGEYLNGKYVEVEVMTGIDIVYVAYMIDDRSWVYMTGGPQKWHSTFDSTILSDGEHKLSIQAKNKRGLIGISTTTITVDNIEPKCTLIAPVKEQYISGTFVFKVQATDLVGVKEVNISVFGKTSLMVFNTQTSLYEYTVGTLGIGDGIYNVTAKAIDFANHSFTSEEIEFMLDNNAPTLSIGFPKPGEYVNDICKIVANSVDPFLDKLQYKIDMTTWIDMNISEHSYEAYWNTSNVSDGSHSLKVRALDKSGKISEEIIEIIVDNTYPTIGIASPVQDEYIDGYYTFKVNAKDTVGISNVTISVFDKELTATYSSLTGYYEQNINTKIYNDGKYTMYAKVYDLSGKANIFGPVNFCINNNPPILNIKKPKENEYISDVYEIEVEVHDKFLWGVEYKIDSGEWKEMNKSENWIGILDTADYADGTHTLTVRAIDYGYKITSVSIKSIIDNNPPICIIAFPSPNQFVEGVVTFKATAVDTVGISYVGFKILGTNLRATYNSQSGYYEYTIDTNIWYEDNVRNLSATAYDLSGKSKESKLVIFKVDNHAPTIKISSPKNMDFVSSYVEFNVSITDAFPGPVEYNVDGTGWLSIFFPWDTTKVADGLHTIVIRAKDLASHATSETMFLTVDNNEPAGWIALPISAQIIGGAIVVKIGAYDAVGIDKVMIYLFEKEFTIPYNAETGYYEATFDTTIYDDGNYNISAEIFDFSKKNI
ncbi:MAG: Ig-like domain-containing protein, partial [Candidatus Thermoplasmatota archaeon]